MPILRISAQQEAFEIGSQLIGILAFPEDEERAKQAANAWCAQFARLHMEKSPDTAAYVRIKYPEYVGMFDWEIRRGIRTTTTRLRDRSAAARMSRGFFFENVYHTKAELPQGVRRLSINELAKFVKRDAGQNDVENVKKRAWRSSRSIIHLAAAFDQLVDCAAANDNGYHIEDIKMTSQILQLAEVHEHIVLKDPRFGVSEEAIVRVRVA